MFSFCFEAAFLELVLLFPRTSSIFIRIDIFFSPFVNSRSFYPPPLLRLSCTVVKALLEYRHRYVQRSRQMHMPSTSYSAQSSRGILVQCLLDESFPSTTLRATTTIGFPKSSATGICPFSRSHHPPPPFVSFSLLFLLPPPPPSLSLLFSSLPSRALFRSLNHLIARRIMSPKKIFCVRGSRFLEKSKW